MDYTAGGNAFAVLTAVAMGTEVFSCSLLVFGEEKTRFLTEGVSGRGAR